MLWCAQQAMIASCSALRSRARRAIVAAEHARIARDLEGTGPPRRDPVGRRADCHGARQWAAAARIRNTALALALALDGDEAGIAGLAGDYRWH